MNKRNLFLIGVAALLATSCTQVYKGIVTLTQVRDSAMRELAYLNKQGYVDVKLDAAITVADEKYRAAARTCELALVAYKNGGNQQDYLNALQAVRVAVGGILDLMRPITQSGKMQVLDDNLKKASAL